MTIKIAACGTTEIEARAKSNITDRDLKGLRALKWEGDFD